MLFLPNIFCDYENLFGTLDGFTKKYYLIWGPFTKEEYRQELGEDPGSKAGMTKFAAESTIIGTNNTSTNIK